MRTKAHVAVSQILTDQGMLHLLGICKFSTFPSSNLRANFVHETPTHLNTAVLHSFRRFLLLLTRVGQYHTRNESEPSRTAPITSAPPTCSCRRILLLLHHLPTLQPPSNSQDEHDLQVNLLRRCRLSAV